MRWAALLALVGCLRVTEDPGPEPVRGALVKCTSNLNCHGNDSVVVHEACALDVETAQQAEFDAALAMGCAVLVECHQVSPVPCLVFPHPDGGL